MIKKMKTAANSLKNGISPGMDGVSKEVLKIVAKHQPDTLKNMYNKCLSGGYYPKAWK